MPAEMKYGPVRWRQEAAERRHADPAGQHTRTAVFIARVWINQCAHHWEHTMGAAAWVTLLRLLLRHLKHLCLTAISGWRRLEGGGEGVKAEPSGGVPATGPQDSDVAQGDFF